MQGGHQSSVHSTFCVQWHACQQLRSCIVAAADILIWLPEQRGAPLLPAAVADVGMKVQALLRHKPKYLF